MLTDILTIWTKTNLSPNRLTKRSRVIKMSLTQLFELPSLWLRRLLLDDRDLSLIIRLNLKGTRIDI